MAAVGWLRHVTRMEGWRDAVELSHATSRATNLGRRIRGSGDGEWAWVGRGVLDEGGEEGHSSEGGQEKANA